MDKHSHQIDLSGQALAVLMVCNSLLLMGSKMRLGTRMNPMYSAAYAPVDMPIHKMQTFKAANPHAFRLHLRHTTIKVSLPCCQVYLFCLTSLFLSV